MAGRGTSPRRRYYRGANLKRAVSIGDLRARTHELLPNFVIEYLEGGAEEEATLERERQAYAAWRFQPRTLVDVSDRSIERTMLGRPAAMPLVVGPTGLNGIFRRGADTQLATAAAKCGVPFCQSTMSNERVEEVAKVPGLRHWFQLYVFGDDTVWRSLVSRAQEAGCEALVLTTNAQVYGNREWDARTRATRTRPTWRTLLDAALHLGWAGTTLWPSGMPRFVNLDRYIPKDRRGFFESAFWVRDTMRLSLGWDDVASIRRAWSGPLLIKGILNLADVRRALDAGIDGIILSSHGGRQLDWTIAPLDLLARARELAGPEKLLLCSGGVRRGADILKAIALGADAVIAGRAPLYGVCAGAAAGAERALSILADELSSSMALLGASRLEEVSADLLVRADQLPGCA